MKANIKNTLRVALALAVLSINLMSVEAHSQTQSQIIIDRAPPIPKEDLDNKKSSSKDRKNNTAQNNQQAPQGMLLMGTGQGAVVAVPFGGEGADSSEEGSGNSEVQIVR